MSGRLRSHNRGKKHLWSLPGSSEGLPIYEFVCLSDDVTHWCPGWWQQGLVSFLIVWWCEQVAASPLLPPASCLFIRMMSCQITFLWNVAKNDNHKCILVVGQHQQQCRALVPRRCLSLLSSRIMIRWAVVSWLISRRVFRDFAIRL